MTTLSFCIGGFSLFWLFWAYVFVSAARMFVSDECEPGDAVLHGCGPQN